MNQAIYSCHVGVLFPLLSWIGRLGPVGNGEAVMSTSDICSIHNKLHKEIMKHRQKPARRLAIVQRRGELHSYDYAVISKSAAFFGTNHFASFRPTKPNLYLKSNHLQVLFNRCFWCFFSRTGFSLQFQDTIGLSSTSSWVLMALNPGYHEWVVNYRTCWFWGGGFLFGNYLILYFLYYDILYIYNYLCYIIAHVIATQLMVNWWFWVVWWFWIRIGLPPSFFHPFHFKI